MRNSSWVLALALLLLVNATSFAQDDDEIIKDYLEVTGFFGAAVPMSGISDWTSPGTDGLPAGPELGAKFGFGTGVEIGYFLKPNIVIGFKFLYTQHELDTDNITDQVVLDNIGDHKHRYFNPYLYLKYYMFGESDFAPYVRGHVGVDNARFTTKVLGDGVEKYRELSYDPAFAFGGGAGIFYYTSFWGGIFVEGNINYTLSESTVGDYLGTEYEFGENALLLDIHAGFTVFFGPE